MSMNYEQHKQAVLDCPASSYKFKAALNTLDDMDCVKALLYARKLLALMERRVNDASSISFKGQCYRVGGV